MNLKGLLIGFLILIISIHLVCPSVPNPLGDFDHDGILNQDDNCYYVYNPNQMDNNLNGFGNCCDPAYLLFPHSTSCDDSNQMFCGNSLIESGEQCDNGLNNGILCNNSTASCNYCSSSCQLISLPYNNQTNNTNHTNPPIPPITPNSCTDCNNDCEKKSLFENVCDVNWECTGWTDCENGVMTRTCKDTNHCDYQYNKPKEIVSCDSLNSNLLVEKNENSLSPNSSSNSHSGSGFIFIFSIIISFFLLLIILFLLLKKR